MYKSKVWLHRSVEEIVKNQGHYWINYTFIDEPKAGEIINITNEMAQDIADEILWKTQYGLGKYMIHKADNMFDPKINDGFSFCIMAIKVQ